MALLSIPGVHIRGISASVPSHKVLNSSLKGFSEEEIELLIKTTGITSRYIAKAPLKASGLCLAAAKKIITELDWNKDEIEILIFVSQTPDYTIPGSSMQLQHALELSSSCLTLDINMGCSGYVYGLSVITSMMKASSLKKGLLLVGDTITQMLSPEDKSTVPIFSDAGSATALEIESSAPNMIFNLQSNGVGYDTIIKEHGDFLKMKGMEVFSFGLKEVVPNLKKLISHFNIDTDAIDFYIFHQANLLLNEAIRRKLKLEAHKVPYSLQEYGNTSCATIPLTIVSQLQKEITTQNLTLAMSGFGVGLSWGSCIVQFSNIVCPKLIMVSNE